MERLKQISESRMQRVPLQFSRFLIHRINWNERLIGISGARGTGKTTLLLQYMKSRVPKQAESLYVSLDDIFFTETPLIFFAEEYYKKGGDYLFLDEVHKYPNWSQELKNIYDNIPDLKIVFTSSSALDIYKGSHDLSRRAIVYNLPGLSFREFIELKARFSFPALPLEEILEGGKDLIYQVTEKTKPLQLFNEYLQTGYYPFFVESPDNYMLRLINIVNQVLENDLPTVFHIDFYSVLKIKKMLSVLSRVVPYKPNIQQLVAQSGASRDTLMKFLYYLEKAEIINWLTKDTFGINYLNKPDKLYLNNTNLMFALASDKPNTGNIRETFLLNQLRVKHKVTYPQTGDFLIDEKYLIETGGKNKTQKQIAGVENAFIAADDIEYATHNKIPLWLFGFLY